MRTRTPRIPAFCAPPTSDSRSSPTRTASDGGDAERRERGGEERGGGLSDERGRRAARVLEGGDERALVEAQAVFARVVAVARQRDERGAAEQKSERAIQPRERRLLAEISEDDGLGGPSSALDVREVLEQGRPHEQMRAPDAAGREMRARPPAPR